MNAWYPGLTIEEMEREAIIAALRFYQGNRTKASDALGISVRTMTNKIGKYKDQGHKVPEPSIIREAVATA